MAGWIGGSWIVLVRSGGLIHVCLPFGHSRRQGFRVHLIISLLSCGSGTWTFLGIDWKNKMFRFTFTIYLTDPGTIRFIFPNFLVLLQVICFIRLCKGHKIALRDLGFALSFNCSDKGFIEGNSVEVSSISSDNSASIIVC